MKKGHLVWLDAEFTSLDYLNNTIVEIAILITDKNLNHLDEGINIIIGHSDEVLENMSEWCLENFSKSGLYQKSQESKITIKQAEEMLLEYVKKHIDGGIAPLCGNSICGDRRIIDRLMPRLENYFHYRNVDVSTFKELTLRWKPEIEKKVLKKKTHRALDDVLESIEELRTYKKEIFDKLNFNVFDNRPLAKPLSPPLPDLSYNGCFSENPIQIGYSEKQPFRSKSETVESEGFCKRSNAQNLNNYAFIDGQNLYRGSLDEKIDLDYTKFFKYLKYKYQVQKAFLFLGYVKSNEKLYNSLRKYGFELIFKKVTTGQNKKAKGNVDVDLTLKCILEKDNFEQAILVTSDGDFAPVVKYLKSVNKFGEIISPSKKQCSFLLRKEAGGKIKFIKDFANKVNKKKRSAAL